MRKILIGLTLSASMPLFAMSFTVEERSKLYTLKLVLEHQLEQVFEAVETAKQNTDAYDALGWSSFSLKKKLKAKNCGDVIPIRFEFS